MMNSKPPNPLVDLSTINAIESLYRHGIHDPWAKQLAGEFADLFIYNPTIRYSITYTNIDSGDHALERPSLLVELIKRNSEIFSPAPISTEHPILLSEKDLYDSFYKFSVWSRNNRVTLKRWVSLHNEAWIQKQYFARVKHKEHEWSFSFEALNKTSLIINLAKELNLTEHDICYAYDLILRYPLYGMLAGQNDFYLNHPIRDAILLPTMKREKGIPPQLAISFKDTISEFAHKMSMDDYTALLHEIRGIVHEYGLPSLSPGEVDKEVIREIASKVSLPPNLRALGKSAAVGAGIIGGIGAIPILGPMAAVIGGILSVSAVIWSGELPRSFARLKWLRWAMEWKVESQIEKRE